jgi:hypothetical protein
MKLVSAFPVNARLVRCNRLCRTRLPRPCLWDRVTNLRLRVHIGKRECASVQPISQLKSAGCTCRRLPHNSGSAGRVAVHRSDRVQNRLGQEKWNQQPPCHPPLYHRSRPTAVLKSGSALTYRNGWPLSINSVHDGFPEMIRVLADRLTPHTTEGATWDNYTTSALCDARGFVDESVPPVARELSRHDSTKPSPFFFGHQFDLACCRHFGFVQRVRDLSAHAHVMRF